MKKEFDFDDIGKKDSLSCARRFRIGRLVKKLPGAEVSEDGTITINGKEVKKS